ncbi:hypothetical protein DSECCO2_293080 [anaerobic digester metagenome]
MTSKEKLIYLIKKYLEGNYSTLDFCNLFVVYHRDMADEETLSEFSEKWLGDLSEICARFSDSPEDLSIPNVYFSEKEIKRYVETFSKQLIY